jgi:hypothetical protein
MSRAMASHEQEGMAGRALLISTDPIISNQLSKSMRRFAIAAEVCTDLATAERLLNTRKFEAVIIDFAVNASANDMLEAVRVSRSNRNAVTVAVVDGRSRQLARLAKAQFVVERDNSSASLSSVFRAALGLIIREHRRYYRCPIDLPARVAREGEPQVSCRVVNISEGGAAIQASVNLKPDSHVCIDFVLATRFTISAEVCWCDNTGRSGLKFHSWPAEQQLQLQEWLRRQLEQMLPERVSKLFV